MEANAKRARLLSLRTAVVLGTIATAIVSGACSSDESAREEEKGPPAGDLSIEPVASSAEAAMPVDATPSPDGSEVYFSATTRRADPDGLGFERLPAVFKVSAKGGPITKLHEGAPLSAPFGITVSDDRVGIHVNHDWNRPPMALGEPSLPLLDHARAVAAELGFTLRDVSVGGASDANFVAGLGLPVICGLGAVGDGAHARGEFAYADRIGRQTALVTGLLHRLADGL